MLGIPAQYYQTIYLIFVSILTFIVGSKYKGYDSSKLDSGYRENLTPSIFVFILISLFIGNRPVSGRYFVDMSGYVAEWYLWDEGVFNFSLSRKNILFDNLRAFLATSGNSYDFFFLLIAVIYFGAMLIAIRKMFPEDTLFAFLIYLAAFSTFSYGTNGIKAGAAASLFLVALAYRDNLKVSIPMAIISWGFHHSMIMVVCSYAIVLLYKNTKAYLILWLASLLIAAAHITFFQSLFFSLAEDQSEGYLDRVLGSGFRIDFILYSAAPVVVGYYAIYKKGIQSKMYSTILNLYLFTNSIWMLCMYANFTNRIAYLSWMFYPIALMYPFLKEHWGEKQYNTAKSVAYGQLAFTLFMTFIYYGIFNAHH